MDSDKFQPARVSRSGKHIIDSDGEQVAFTDKRIVHAWPMGLEGHRSRLIEKVFQSRGLNFRVCCGAGSEVLKRGKKICTGRECVPFVTVAGNIYQDLVNNRRPNEITLYHMIDQVGPCQNGAWPIVLDAYIKRNQIKNVVMPVRLRTKDNFMGQGRDFARDNIVAYILSDILDEAEGSLRVLARDKTTALGAFGEATEKLYGSFLSGPNAFRKSLGIWAADLKGIPLVQRPADAPKILIFGGLNVQLAFPPIRNYFSEHNVITKVIDLVESILWQSSEGLVSQGFRAGRDTPQEHFNPLPYIAILAESKLKKLLLRRRKKTQAEKEKRIALASWMTILFVESMVRNLRKIARRSGLLYDEHIPYKAIVQAGDPYLRANVFIESTPVIGRYLETQRRRRFDGMVNIGSFSCQPSQISLSIMRSMAVQDGMPLLNVDCDGENITPHQKRLLENLLVQAKRYHANKR